MTHEMPDLAAGGDLHVVTNWHCLVSNLRGALYARLCLWGPPVEHRRELWTCPKFRRRALRRAPDRLPDCRLVRAGMRVPHGVSAPAGPSNLLSG